MALSSVSMQYIKGNDAGLTMHFFPSPKGEEMKVLAGWEGMGVGGGATLMRYEHRTCKNIDMHSLGKENTDAQLGRHQPPLQ